ncbi:hypothetical protein L211DRAFT_852638 [Terfezia boudieri ATCC MYA-4762]|uniref:Uncharacterized protein n=1 Tax=Terfezia boudieri ATCC MYA-4762 TaxID=1051890 RepID=A0A3N4LAY6_9PEZI|nr:hypothetical protein L211DRAFT_852638 [Terfezia boudieri ATCC MYA-4762]
MKGVWEVKKNKVLKREKSDWKYKEAAKPYLKSLLIPSLNVVAANPTVLIMKAIFHSLLTLIRKEVFTAKVILVGYKKSSYWSIDLDYAYGYANTDSTSTPPSASYWIANIAVKIKQIAVEIEAEIPGGIGELQSGKTIKPATSRVYVGKVQVLSQKEVDKSIAKVIKKKEGEQAAAIKRTERATAKKRSEEAKAMREAEYKVACNAVLASGLPKPKKPRASTNLKTGLE